MKNSLIALPLTLIAVLVVCLIPGQTIRYGSIQAPSQRVLKAIITGYSSEEGQTDSSPYLTASQKQVQDGFIACPRKYEFGQRVEIQGKIYTCEDRKNIRYESYPEEYFDIWFSSTEMALNWGIQEKEIIITSPLP